MAPGVAYGQNLALRGAEKGKTPKETDLGREGGRHAPQKSPQRLKTRFPLCVVTFVWGCHTESPANSFAG